MEANSLFPGDEPAPGRLALVRGFRTNAVAGLRSGRTKGPALLIDARGARVQRSAQDGLHDVRRGDPRFREAGRDAWGAGDGLREHRSRMGLTCPIPETKLAAPIRPFPARLAGRPRHAVSSVPAGQPDPREALSRLRRPPRARLWRLWRRPACHHALAGRPASPAIRAAPNRSYVRAVRRYAPMEHCHPKEARR